MKRLLLIAVAVSMLPGCLAGLGLGYGNTVPSATQPGVGPGGSLSSGGVNARFSDGSAGGALAGAAILGFLFGRGDDRVDMGPAPALDPGRNVNEQDCAQPIANPTANLRCR